MDHKFLSSIINPLSILTFFILFEVSLSEDQNFTACAPQSCGDNSKISFPFWIEGVQKSYCGYPGFNVSCSNDSQLTIKLPDEKLYAIQKIWYKNQSLHVYSVEAAHGTPCIQYTAKNLTFNSSDKLKFTEPDVGSAYVYLHCETPLPPQLVVNNVSCGENGEYGVVVLGINAPKLQGGARICKKGVKLPVELYGRDSFMNLTDLYKTLMIRGFGMEWFGMEGNCSVCHNSGGRCGFIAKTDEYMCFCADQTYQMRCPGKKKWKLIVPIVISAAAAVVILPLVLIFLQRRHNRRKESSSNLLARNISNDPYSKSELERGNVYFGIPIFPYSELEEATNHFDPAKELGDGGFGTVYYGKLRDGREVAVKRLYENNCKRVEQFMNEIKILTLLRHQNLVSLYGCTSRHSRELLLVYEYISNGTVADHLHGEMANPSPLTWPVRMSIAIETARALAYLHASDIIHRDVKTNNILLDNKFSVKVADFGLSRLFPTAATHVSTAPQGTPGYVDPEYHQCYQLTEKSDVFSFGVVLIELLSSMQAVDITRHRQEINLANLALNRIQNQAFDELIDSKLGFNLDSRVTGMTIAVAELAFRCLQHDKEMRPSMQEVLDDLLIIDSQDYDEDETDGVKKAQPRLHDSDDDASLLKNMRLRPVSPTSVAEKWISTGSTISSVGG